MKTYRFVCERHKDFGELGWRQEKQPGFDPLWGMAVAHDIMEHFPDGDESPADEFQALGAGILIRGEQYYANKGQMTTSPAENAASDVPEIIRHIIYENMHLPEPPVTRALPRELEDYISEFAKRANELVESEFGEDEDKEAMKAIVKKAKGWIRIGIRKAQKRYKGRLFEALSTFCEIEHQADKLLKHDAIEGQVMVVKIERGVVRCEIEEPEYADY